MSNLFFYYLKDIEFNNGCRASSWRQMHGDITYLVIQPFKQDLLTVTCNRSGIYENNVKNKNTHIIK